MSKATRLKAARRKQHNKTAKARAQEWKERCAVLRAEGEAARARRAAETATETKISEPLPPTDPLARLFDGVLDGGKLPGSLYHPDGTLDLLKITSRVHSLGGLAFIDTENSVFGSSIISKGSDGLFDAICEPGMPMARKDFKIGDPKAKHTEQCMARHMARYTEAGRIEAELLAKGEEALACYLYPSFMICTCDEPEDEDGSAKA